jgi:hypothetical protein
VCASPKHQSRHSDAHAADHAGGDRTKLREVGAEAHARSVGYRERHVVRDPTDELAVEVQRDGAVVPRAGDSRTVVQVARVFEPVSGKVLARRGEEE